VLNKYYESELNKLKGLAAEFAQSNPALAPMLLGTSTDPDVERLLEGVAFLTGLTRKKLDDEFPEFVQELVNLLLPHYLRPVPASTLIAFEPRSALRESMHVSQGTKIDSLPVDGTKCRFSTSADLNIEPLVLNAAKLVQHPGAGSYIQIDLELTSQNLNDWDCEKFKLFLSGGYSEGAKLLLLLTNFVSRITISCGDGISQELSLSDIQAIGFDTPMIAYPSNAFTGYRNLQEFFVQPEKFLFINICGLRKWTQRKGNKFTLRFNLSSMPSWMPEIQTDKFMLNVVPAINVFEHPADPINHDHKVAEYRVRPEGLARHHYQIYSVDRVVGYQRGDGRERVYTPFGLYGHNPSHQSLSYRTTLREATVGRGLELFLSINYPATDEPKPETLSLRLTCTNAALPESLKVGDISQPTSSTPDRMAFRNIRPVAPAENPPVGEKLLWRLVSHLSLNFLSIANAANLKALLSLYLFSDRNDRGHELANQRRINGIEDVIATPETRLIGRGSLMRGQLVRIRCKEEFFAGIGDMFVFGCVLERFIADYASVNAYTRVEMEDSSTGVVFKWPARLGHQPLL